MTQDEQREKMVGIIQDSVGGCARNWAEIIADGLLANGMLVPPCKIGDRLYYIAHRANDGKLEKRIAEEVIEEITWDSHAIYAHIPRALLIDLADLGKTVFLTKEEAEAALKEREKNG